MRWLDMHVGRLILTVVNFFLFFKFSKNHPKPKPENIKKILVIKLFGMGSILLMTPMLRSLKILFPQSKITLLTHSGNLDFAYCLNDVDHVLTLEKKFLTGFLGGVFRNLIFLWKDRQDVVVDCEFFSNFTSMFSLATLSPLRVGFHMRFMPQRNHVTHKVPINTHHHIVYAFDSLAVALGSNYRKLNSNSLSLKAPANSLSSAVFRKLNLHENSKVVAVNPNASNLSFRRRWPSEYYISLISNLAEKWSDYSFVFVGSSSEKAYVKNIIQQLRQPNIFDSSGQLDIGEYLAFLNKSTLIITNDSLPVHVASAYEKDIVVFWGPESPNFYGPLNENSLSFFENIPCSPCLVVFDSKAENGCKDNICLKQITPEFALEKIEKKFFTKREWEETALAENP